MLEYFKKIYKKKRRQKFSLAWIRIGTRIEVNPDPQPLYKVIVVT
jgi:hypothetical protein